jgi:LysM repeat protein
MGGIAKRYHVSLPLLTDANPRARGRVLQIGQQIIVPTGGALSSSVARRVSDPVVPASNTSTGFHRLRRGETLSGLADEYDVSVNQLRAWNALGRSETIRAGQLLRISPLEKAADSRVHLVRRGETLRGLARQYGVSVQALREANGLSERDPIRAGHPLRIPG